MTSGKRVKGAPKHVSPRRIWAFIYEQLELLAEEQRHLNMCIECAEIFKLCVTCENWEQVLAEISSGDYGAVA